MVVIARTLVQIGKGRKGRNAKGAAPASAGTAPFVSRQSIFKSGGND